MSERAGDGVIEGARTLDDYLALIEEERDNRPAEAMLADEIARLRAINSEPAPFDFLDAAVKEARYQQTIQDDTWKSDEDWFWLIGYLAGKALHRPGDDSTEKMLHRITTVAAACANWHADVLERAQVPG